MVLRVPTPRPPAAPVAAERARLGDALDRRAGPIGRRVERERNEVVLEVRRRRQRHAELPHRQRLQDRRVADVVAGRDRHAARGRTAGPTRAAPRRARSAAPPGDALRARTRPGCGPRRRSRCGCRRRAGGWRWRRCRPGAGRRQTADSGRAAWTSLSTNYSQVRRNRAKTPRAARPIPRRRHRPVRPPGGRAPDPGPLPDHPGPVPRHDDQLRRPGDAVDRRHATCRATCGLDAVTLGYLLSAFSWSYVALQIPGGWLLDRLGSRRVYRWSLLGWSAVHDGPGRRRPGSARAAPRSPRCSGCGSGSAPPKRRRSRPTAASSRSWFPTAERGLASAIFNSAQYFSTVLFYPIMGAVTHSFGWPWVFVLMGAIGLVFGLAWNRLVHEPADHPLANAAEVEHIRSGGGLVDLDQPGAGGRQRRRAARADRRAAAATACCSASSSASTASTC